jgi:hypothetical protein
MTSIVAYPAPDGLVTSPDLKVEVNGTLIWVERVGGKALEALDVANFSCAGELAVKVTCSAAVKSFVIKPKSRGVAGHVSGKELSFTLAGPGKVYVEINRLPHLAVFANPLEVNPPRQSDAGVVYFGPGAHSPGTLNLQSNQIVYIAGGAVVNADVRGSDLEHVRVLGRGIINGNVKISNTSDLEVSGVFIRNTDGWSNTLTNCSDSAYRNVKVFGYQAQYSVDGINPCSCRRVTIDDCFIRTRDDCVAIKTPDPAHGGADGITVQNCVLCGWAYADGVTMGYELNGGPVQNILVKNCDILRSGGSGMTKGHAGFSIVCDGPALVTNVRFEDVRVEEDVEFKNMELICTAGTYYGKGPAGHIRGIHMKNVQWANARKPFVLAGYGRENLVEDVTFEHCTVGGKALRLPGDAMFKVNEFVRNVRIID